jgi:hypothetical protein
MYKNACRVCLGYVGVFLFREPKDTDRKKTKKSHISFRHSVTSLVHIPMSAPTRKALSTPAGARFHKCTKTLAESVLAMWAFFFLEGLKILIGRKLKNPTYHSGAA